MNLKGGISTKAVISQRDDINWSEFMKREFLAEGMTCTSCAMKIENTLKEIKGVINANVSYSTSVLNVDYDADKIDENIIINAVKKLGYKASPMAAAAICENTAITSKKHTKVIKLLGLMIVAIALYYILNNTSVFNFIPEVNQTMGYGLLFVVGLLTSVHCIAMCGGINLSQCVAYSKDANESIRSKLKPSILYNTGRVISYTIIGGIVGALGSVVSFSGTAKGIVALVAGIFMIIMGLNMMNLFPWLRKIVPRVPKLFGKKIHGAKKGRGPLVIGLLNGLMPCGPLQAMQLYALGTGSFFAGALSMFLFSVGTVPLMFGFGALSTILSSKFTKNLMKVSAVIVIVLGVVMLGRGFNQSGISTTALADVAPSNIATVQEDVQIVTTNMKGNEYEPIMVEAGVPVRWTINAEEKELNGCNNPVTIPKYGIEKRLVSGENIIEFTPTEEGNIVYTCWMGMISGNIQVVSDISDISEDEIEQITENKPLYELEIAGETCCTLDQDSATIEDTNNNAESEIALGEIKDGVQRVSIDVNASGFSPWVVILQKSIKTEWTINGKSLNSCNSSLIFPAQEARLDLQEGENLIEFIPSQSFSFSCWMGMINGYVAIIDDIENFDLETIIIEAEESALASAGGCCG